MQTLTESFKHSCRLDFDKDGGIVPTASLHASTDSDFYSAPSAIQPISYKNDFSPG